MPRILAVLFTLLLSSPLFAGSAEDQALGLINEARAQAGCNPLQPEPRLTAAALGHAQDMAEANYFGHKGRDGSNFTSRIRRQGFPMGAGAENIAAGYRDPQQIVSGWLSSAGHRKNMLNCRYRRTGLAMFYQPDDQPIMGNSFPYRAYWVQVFSK